MRSSKSVGWREEYAMRGEWSGSYLRLCCADMCFSFVLHGGGMESLLNFSRHRRSLADIGSRDPLLADSFVPSVVVVAGLEGRRRCRKLSSLLLDAGALRADRERTCLLELRARLCLRIIVHGGGVDIEHLSSID